MLPGKYRDIWSIEKCGDSIFCFQDFTLCDKPDVFNIRIAKSVSTVTEFVNNKGKDRIKSRTTL